MRLYGVDMSVVAVMSVGVVVIIIVEYEVDPFGGVEHLDMGVLFIKRSIQVCSKPMYPMRK